MTDLAKTIIPKSDQLNADDLIAGPVEITITRVRGCDEADQPIAVHFEGDNNKPYKPCKSMRRVLVRAWGADGAQFAGRRLRLYRDEGVQFGGIKVGGIRISHMSHIDRPLVVALTVTRAKRAPYTVEPLVAQVSRATPPREDAPREDTQRRAPPEGLSLSQRAEAYEARLREAPNPIKLESYRRAAASLLADLDRGDPERKVELDQLYDDRLAALEQPD